MNLEIINDDGIAFAISKCDEYITLSLDGDSYFFDQEEFLKLVESYSLVYGLRQNKSIC